MPSPHENLDEQKARPSSSLDSAEKPGMPASTNSTSSLVRGRPKTTYFHGGIGGAGNYRKVIRGSNPNSAAPNPHTEHRESPISRGISSLFGNNGGGKAAPGSGMTAQPTEDDLARANVHSKVSPSRGFLGIGGLGNRRQQQRQRQQSPSSDVSMATNADSGYVSSSNAPTTHLGAAEIMRRKILGEKQRARDNSR
ncbi:MAG: hypothetical protein L6R40_006557 [Gallowayella cf. fulva]|nr:MAG: hypothetical protein L6R40_006557 [Xanthomendoza cf. fulva]